MSVAAILLAAGRARRFGAGDGDSKVVAVYAGRPLVWHVASTVLTSRARPLVVVTGHAAAAVGAALNGLAVRLIYNPDYALGIASSLARGLAALPRDTRGVLILLADMPLVHHETLDRLIACFEQRPAELDAVIPTFEGRHGNPVLIGRNMFAALDGLSGDEGARKVLGSPGRRLAYCAVDDRGIEIDVDTQEALRDLRDGA